MGSPETLCRRQGELWVGAQRVRDGGWADAAERAARWCAWSALGGHPGRFFSAWQGVGGQFVRLWEGRAASAMECLATCGALARGSEPRWRAVLSETPERSWRRELEGLAPHAGLLAIGDPEYPAGLNDLPDPPVFLYVRGQRAALAGSPTLAVVGSRDADPAALAWARQCASELAGQGVLIVSGGALGVDAAAHQGALDALSPTIVVLPGGLDRLTPSRHAALFAAIAHQGVLVTEYPLAVESRAYHFARRNRLIAAMGAMTLVVRARLGGGTWLTARAAAELGREVLAVPTDLADVSGEGGNAILALGGRAVRHAGDVRRWMGAQGPASVGLALPEVPSASARRHGRGSARLGHAEDAVEGGIPGRDGSYLVEEARVALARMCCEDGRTGGYWELDELVRALDMGVGRLTAVLLALELDGWVEKVAGLAAWRLLARIRESGSGAFGGG